MTSSDSATPLARERYWHVDWLRVIALGLLLVYHTLCVFDSRAWVLKSDYAGPWADGVIALLTPWRMSLVFFIGGVASRFLIDKTTMGGFAVDRLKRLVLPFVFAVVVLVPPQEYVWRQAHDLVHNSYWEFWAFQAWTVVQYHGLAMPSFAHVWFLPYLFIYALAGALVVRYAKPAFAFVERQIERAPFWSAVLGVTALFVIVDAFVIPVRARSIFILGDVTGHLRFAPVFFLGLLVARSRPFWDRLVTWRVPLSVAAVILMVASLGVLHAAGPGVASPTDVNINTVRAIYGGAMLFAVLAWGTFALNKPSALLSYLTDAILPVYLLHQSFMVVFGYVAHANTWPVWLEMIFLFGVATIAPFVVYQGLIRYNPWLRVLFGQRPKLRTASQPSGSSAPVKLA